MADTIGSVLRKVARRGLSWVRLERAEGWGWAYYAQFARDDGGAMFGEVVGSHYIDDPAAKLTTGQLERLRSLAWGDPIHEPNDDDEIQPRNQTRSWPLPIDFEAASALVVVTVSSVYGLTTDDEGVLTVDPW